MGLMGWGMEEQCFEYNLLGGFDYRKHVNSLYIQKKKKKKFSQ